MAGITGTIVHKKAGEVIPNLYLKRVIDAHKAGVGFALVLADSPGEVYVDHALGQADLQGTDETQTEFKDSDIIYQFCSSPNKLLQEDVSPFVLLEDQGKIKIVAFVDAQFTGQDKPESSHSSAFHYMNDVLKPKIEFIWGLAKDTDKMVEALNNESVAKEVFNATADGGTIIVCVADDKDMEIIRWTQGNEDQGEFESFWTSNVMGYKEGEFPAAKAAEASEEKPLTMAQKLMAKRQKPVVETTAAAVSDKNYNKRPDPAPLPTTTLVEDKVYPPPSVQGKQALRNWYETTFGFKPEGYKNRPGVSKSDPRVKSTFRSFGAAQPAMAGVAKETITAPKPTVPSIASTTPIKAKEVVGGEIPIISAEQRKWGMDEFLTRPNIKKYLDIDGASTMDPKQIASNESEIPSIVEQLGLKGLEQTFHWNWQDLCSLGQGKLTKAEYDRSGIELLARLGFDYRLAYIKRLMDTPLKDMTQAGAEPQQELTMAEKLKRRRAVM